MKHLRFILLLAPIALTSCATERYEALESRQAGYDERHDSRMDRRELRSQRADERYDRE